MSIYIYISEFTPGERERLRFADLHRIRFRSAVFEIIENVKAARASKTLI